jgi:hypothetical protein
MKQSTMTKLDRSLATLDSLLAAMRETVIYFLSIWRREGEQLCDSLPSLLLDVCSLTTLSLGSPAACFMLLCATLELFNCLQSTETEHHKFCL